MSSSTEEASTTRRQRVGKTPDAPSKQQTGEHKMTLAGLKSLIRTRNTFQNRTPLQFTLDLANHGIRPGEIDPSVEADVNGARDEWRTPFGRPVERQGVLSLEPF
jgi:hypothetical protein